MKIRLALLDSDKNYLDRLSVMFTNRYPDKIEFHSFTDEQMALDNLKSGKMDVFLANESFKIERREIPERCCFAYIAEDSGIEGIREERAVSKYQRAEMFYKQILSLYAENARNVTGYKLNDRNGTRVFSFVSLEGGAGSSTVAVAFAQWAAKRGKKVLYLNLEQFGGTETFLEGEGQYDFSDVLFALKSGKGSMALKLESMVRRDVSGVYFYCSTKNALDLLEMEENELCSLLGELCATGGYDEIVIDTDFIFDKKTIRIFEMSDKIVFVDDGAEISNAKLVRGYQALRAYGHQKGIAILEKAGVFYNKFSSRTSRMVEGLELKNFGGIPRFENGTAKQIIGQLVSLGDFEKMIAEED